MFHFFFRLLFRFSFKIHGGGDRKTFGIDVAGWYAIQNKTKDRNKILKAFRGCEYKKFRLPPSVQLFGEDFF